MTVEQLIKELAELPKDLEVIFNQNEKFFSVNIVSEIQTVEKDGNEGAKYVYICSKETDVENN